MVEAVLLPAVLDSRLWAWARTIRRLARSRALRLQQQAQALVDLEQPAGAGPLPVPVDLPGVARLDEPVGQPGRAARRPATGQAPAALRSTSPPPPPPARSAHRCQSTGPTTASRSPRRHARPAARQVGQRRSPRHPETCRRTNSPASGSAAASSMRQSGHPHRHNRGFGSLFAVPAPPGSSTLPPCRNCSWRPLCRPCC